MGNESGMKTHAPEQAPQSGCVLRRSRLDGPRAIGGLGRRPARRVTLNPAQLGGAGPPRSRMSQAPGRPRVEARRPDHGEAADARPRQAAEARRRSRSPIRAAHGRPAGEPREVNFTKKLVKDGQGFTGVSPPDTTGAVGPSHFIQLINGPTGRAS